MRDAPALAALELALAPLQRVFDALVAVEIRVASSHGACALAPAAAAVAEGQPPATTPAPFSATRSPELRLDAAVCVWDRWGGAWMRNEARASSTQRHEPRQEGWYHPPRVTGARSFVNGVDAQQSSENERAAAAKPIDASAPERPHDDPSVKSSAAGQRARLPRARLIRGFEPSFARVSLTGDAPERDTKSGNAELPAASKPVFVVELSAAGSAQLDGVYRMQRLSGSTQLEMQDDVPVFVNERGNGYVVFRCPCGVLSDKWRWWCIGSSHLRIV